MVRIRGEMFARTSPHNSKTLEAKRGGEPHRLDGMDWNRR